MNPRPAVTARPAAGRGFTLIEVLVALVIVALGMSALLETLSASAENISALRTKGVAEWIAMNQIASTRLALAAPAIGSSAGDVHSCAHSDWHWQQRVAAVDAVPGLLSITVSVRRTGAAADANSNPGNPATFDSPGSAITASGCVSTSTSSTASTSAATSTSGAGAAPSGGAQAGSLLGANSGNGQNWLITLTGFRGNSLAAASGESPDWAGSTFAGEAGASGIPGATGGIAGNAANRTPPAP